ncbi:glycogen debranching enzyme, putative [Chitinophaga rupis]|uniref:Glycogen debranching enzyme, putative n=1 Tax=Chitinophaga rupis TaxID=573321 RepID=A0A1H7PXV9_9BACT|nr:amylo-alpha-1,6-glucosidase [Chitinophaga rupis]SEL40416.1 glycogen debranching enzyme, putative [Chitinophaga rupis]
MLTAFPPLKQAGEGLMSSPESAISKEFLQTSGYGAYSAATICGCNTRKYHGLLAAPAMPDSDEMHVLLSSLDEKVLSEDTAWRLSTHRYTGVYYPEGYRYITAFSASPFPSWIYEFGNAVLKKELLFDGQTNTLLIRYTLLDAPAEVTLCLLPMLAFRNVHALTRHNEQVNQQIIPLENGIAVQPYECYSTLYLQLSGPVTFTHTPDWYYHYEYEEEAQRGYDFHEDLYTPGYFELSLLPGQSIIFGAGLEGTDPAGYDTAFNTQVIEKKKPHTMEDHLKNAAAQFIIHKGDTACIKAGYYWFGTWGRDTCISLPGLTLLTDNAPAFIQVLNTLLSGLKDGLLPNTDSGGHIMYNTADASLWLIWALQQYVHYGYESPEEVWHTYHRELTSILQHYSKGTHYDIKMDVDGLLNAGRTGDALTWMDAVVDGGPVTPRNGKAVELNALWYNAICFCLELAYEAGDSSFEEEWGPYPPLIRTSFTHCFWDYEKRYLADHVQDGFKDWSIRPNQLFAVSLYYSPLTAHQQAEVMEKVVSELLTSRGLRTLSTSDPRYHGHYGGNQQVRDIAYHQGTVWPWLLAHFTTACLRVFRDAALPMLEELYAGMEPVLEEGCLHTIPEVFDGDYPHNGGGAVAQAWSVAELIRMKNIIHTYKTKPVPAA